MNKRLSSYEAKYDKIPLFIKGTQIFSDEFFSLKYINIAMVTVLKNMTNILTATGEYYIFHKRQNQKVWTAMFLMVRDTPISFCVNLLTCSYLVHNMRYSF